MRFLIDMNLTPRWVHTLSEAGHVAVHWSLIGPVTASDSEICEYARSNDYALLTNDLDFPRILAYTRSGKPSIILLRGEPLTPELRGGQVLRAIDDCSAELLSGAILTIDWSDRPRARILPLS